jgi:hypothetical protein
VSAGTYNAEGVTAIADALRVNGALTSINLSNNVLCGVDNRGQGTYTAEGITAIAEALRVNGTLTELSIYGNHIGDEGVGAICEAIQSNKETKLASLNMGFNSIGQVGAKSAAALDAVTGTLTVANLLRNQLDAESAKMLAEVAKQKGISLCGIQRDQTTADFSNQNLKPPDAILLASDLSQAVVTGGLTSINLSGNNLTHYRMDMTGIKELAAALGVNGALTECNLNYNPCIREDGEALIRKAIQEKAGFKLCI